MKDLRTLYYDAGMFLAHEDAVRDMLAILTSEGEGGACSGVITAEGDLQKKIELIF